MSIWVRRRERWVWREIVDVDGEVVVAVIGVADVESEVDERRGVGVGGCVEGWCGTKLFVVLLRLEAGVAGFLKMPSLDVGRAGAWLVPLRCLRGETKGLWTPEPSLRRLASGSGVDVSVGIGVVG